MCHWLISPLLLQGRSVSLLVYIINKLHKPWVYWALETQEHALPDTPSIPMWFHLPRVGSTAAYKTL
jgi:hypothetical protein